jgi:hypothetical protein
VSERWTEVSAAEQAVTLALDDCCAPLASRSELSPIDRYYEGARHILTLGTTDSLAASPTLGRLLVLGLVGNVEVYLREVISGVIRVCPIARTAAASHPIPYGAVAYYGAEGPEEGLFESISLADPRQIRGRTDKLLGVAIPNGGSLSAALDEFGQVCELRHAAIHQHGTLNSANVATLGLAATHGMRRVELTVTGLHSVAAVCQSAVRAYNRFVLEKVVERWCAQGVLSGTWQRDKALFQPLFRLMRSREDSGGPSNAYTAFLNLRPTLLRITGGQQASAGP